MIRFLLISCLTVLLSFSAHSQVLYGSQIDYKQLDTFKYEVRLKVYADCRNATFVLDTNTSYFYVHPNKRADKKALSPTLISTESISPFADSITVCSYSTSWFKIIEYTYLDTVDFNTTFNSFKSDTLIFFEFSTERMAIADNITISGTYRQSRNFAELYLQKKVKGGYFTSEPMFQTGINMPQYDNHLVDINNGNDSLIYGFFSPYTFSGNVTFTGTWIYYNYPWSVYFPGSIGGPPYTNPNASPPIGIYFNKHTSEVISTPITNGNYDYGIEAIIYNKDSAGNRQVAGKMRRDLMLLVRTVPFNDPPIVNGPYTYNVCEGSQLCFNITTSDVVFTPLPPATAPAPDTTFLEWDGALAEHGATFTILNDSARLKIGQFCWTPSVGMASHIPYYFTARVRDNNGAIIAKTRRTFSINVRYVAKATIKIEPLKCGSDLVGISRNVLLDSNFQGTPLINTQILDSLGNALNTERLFFNSINGAVSTQLSDTLLGDTSGVFILQTVVNSTPHNCPITLYDTISIQLNTPQADSIAKEKVVCNQVEDTLRIPGNWTSIHWNTGETTPFKVVRTTGDYVAYAQDSCGNSFRFFTKVFMHYTIKSPLVDSILCNGGPLNYTYNDTNAYTILWSNGKKTNAFTTYNQGLIWVRIENRCDYLVDNITVLKFNTPKTLLPKDTFLCSGDSLLLMSLPADKSASKRWSTGETTDTLRVKLPGIYWLKQENYCGTSTDSIFIRGSVKPKVQLPKDTFLCFGDSLTLKSEIVDTIATKVWNDASISDSLVVQQNGIYWLKLTNECGVSTDTINITEKQMPTVSLGTDKFADLPFSIQLKADSAETYLWSTGSNSSTIQVTDTGCYWVQVGNVCGTAADTICIADTLSGTGLAILQKLGVEVYPNPASDILIIQSASLPIQSVEIVDLAGRQIVKYDVNQPNFHLRVTEIASGTYFLKLGVENKIYWSKVLIDRR